MKETLNINVGSQSFTIDCDAYQLLKRYLDDVASRLPEEDRETMNDVESRLAEIFRERIPSPMMVIDAKLVRQAMAQMGRPEEFGERRNASTPPPVPDPVEACLSRKLYRPTVGRSIGGVCVGLARYLNLDTLLVRVLSVLLLLFASFGFWAYIILWILMPSEERVRQECKRNVNG